MSNPTNIVRQYFESVQLKDFDKVRQLLHPQYSYTSSDGERQEGPEAGLAIAKLYTSAFPDLKFDFIHYYTDNNVVVSEYIARGTHKGELEGITATGRQAEVRVCNVIEVRDGRIYTERDYFDMANLLQQLSVTE